MKIDDVNKTDTIGIGLIQTPRHGNSQNIYNRQDVVDDAMNGKIKMSNDLYEKEYSKFYDKLPSLTYLPFKIRMRVLEKTREASKRSVDAGYSGFYNDGGAGRLLDKVIAFVKGYNTAINKEGDVDF